MADQLGVCVGGGGAAEHWVTGGDGEGETEHRGSAELRKAWHETVEGSAWQVRRRKDI